MDQQEQAYPRPCPVCGLAMIGEKDDPERGKRRFDRFVCLSCGSSVGDAKSAPAAMPTAHCPRCNAAIRRTPTERDRYRSSTEEDFFERCIVLYARLRNGEASSGFECPYAEKAVALAFSQYEAHR